MTETIHGKDGVWYVRPCMNDLVEQAGLDSDDLEYGSEGLRYKDRQVRIFHVHDDHLIVNIEGKDDADAEQVMEAFATVVKYKPFCKYNLHLLIEQEDEVLSYLLPTYEWDKIDPDGRVIALCNKPNVSDIVLF